MYYYSIYSNDKMFHSKECSHIKTIKQENLREFESMDRAHRAQYKFCPCCSPVGKRVKREMDAVKAFCSRKGLVCFSFQDNLHVYTNRSHWQVGVSKDATELELYRRNAFGEDTTYRKQEFQADTLMEYVEHIEKQDKAWYQGYGVA